MNRNHNKIDRILGGTYQHIGELEDRAYNPLRIARTHGRPDSIYKQASDRVLK